jgi:hypothetical protein
MIIRKMPSIDLMVHITYYHLQGHSFRDIQINLHIPKSTAHRWYVFCNDYFSITNDIDNIINMIDKQKETKNNIITSAPILDFIKRSLNIQPFQTLQMLQEKIEKKFNEIITTKMISRYIKIIKFSKKKATRRFYNIKNMKEHKLNRNNFKKKLKN